MGTSVTVKVPSARDPAPSLAAALPRYLAAPAVNLSGAVAAHAAKRPRLKYSEPASKASSSSRTAALTPRSPPRDTAAASTVFTGTRMRSPSSSSSRCVGAQVPAS